MSAILSQDDYRRVLREEMTARFHANPQYSQRAFARDLKLAPHRLSEVLHGKQGLSREVAERLSQRLGLSAPERRHFCDLVEREHARSPVKRRLAAVRVASTLGQHKGQRLGDSVFRAMSDWEHLAILELTTVRGFKSDVDWIARQLGIKSAQAGQAVDRLLELKLLTKERGRLRAANDLDIAPGGVPSEAIRKFHDQVLERARSALFTQDLAEREFMTAIVGVPADQIEAVKTKIRSFVGEICQDLGKAGAPASVYALGVQFFRISTPDHS